jgi:hypothetical protein
MAPVSLLDQEPLLHPGRFTYPEVMTKAQIRFGYVIPAPTEDES